MALEGAPPLGKTADKVRLVPRPLVPESQPFLAMPGRLDHGGSAYLLSCTVQLSPLPKTYDLSEHAPLRRQRNTSEV